MSMLKGIAVILTTFFLWHKSEDINKKKKKGNFQNFSSFTFYVYKLCMIMCISIAPYHVKLCLVDETLCKKLLLFHKEMVSSKFFYKVCFLVESYK